MERQLLFGLLSCMALLLPARTPLAAETVEGAQAAGPESVVALNQYLASTAERRWEDALGPAQRLVELARTDHGERSRQLAEALVRLGGVQYALRDLTLSLIHI